MRDEGFIQYLKKRQFSHGTMKTCIKVLDLYTRWLETENMEATRASYQDILAFMKSLKHASQRTVQHYVNTVSHYYAYLLEEGEIMENPVTDIEVKGVKRKVLYQIIEPHELNGLYANYPEKTLGDKRNKTMLGLMVYQGLKTEELAKLETEHVKLREGKIEVPGGRKSNGRTLDMQPAQVMDMYDYILKTRPELLATRPKRKYQERQQTDKLLIGEGGSSEHFSNYITQLMKKLKTINPGIKNAKQIRASVITKWLKQYNLREAQYRAGHRYISSTEGYKQNDLEGLKEEIEQYHPLG